MAGLFGKFRSKQWSTAAIENREMENPYAMASEFPRETIFDGELKLLLMDGYVENN
jgi:hypothetical protein